MEKMLRSERELRNGLIETLRARHPEATEAALQVRSRSTRSKRPGDTWRKDGVR